MPDFDVNYLAVLVASVSMMVSGFLWYGPLFGKTWLQAVGKSREELGGAVGPTILSMIGAIVAALALAWLIGAAPSPDLVTGAVYGLVIAIAFVTTNVLTTAAFESRPSTLTTLGVTYQIVGLTTAERNICKSAHLLAILAGAPLFTSPSRSKNPENS